MSQRKGWGPSHHSLHQFRQLSVMLWITTRTGKAKAAISWFFFVTGAALGNWASLLPFVKDEQNISNGELGFILLAAVGGALIALPLITYCNNHYGTGWSTTFSGVLLVLLFPLVGIVYNVGVFTVGVLMLGFVIGCLDVSVNGQAVTCEKMTRAPTIGLFHCVYSFGAFVGAMIGGLLMELEDCTVLKEVLIFGAILLVPGVLFSAWLYSHQEEKLLAELHDQRYERLLQQGGEGSIVANPLAGQGSNQDSSLRSGLQVSGANGAVGSRDDSYNHKSAPVAVESGEDGAIAEEWRLYDGADDDGPGVAAGGRPLARLLECCGCGMAVKYIAMAQVALLALLACFAEGSVNDWSAIYFTDSLHATPFVSTLGFAAFELSVAVGRYCSDFAVLRLGRRRLLVASGGVATFGMALVVVAPSMVSVHTHRAALQGLSIVGFFICGLGLSSLAPSAVSLAGSSAIARAAGISSADSIATVTSVSYLGIMFGPPLLGGVSVLLHSLRWSFAISAAVVSPIALVALCIDQDVFDAYDHGMRKSVDLGVAAGAGAAVVGIGGVGGALGPNGHSDCVEKAASSL